MPGSFIVGDFDTLLLESPTNTANIAPPSSARQARMLQTTLACIRDFTCIFDLSAKLIYANPPLLDYWSLPLSQVEGKSLADLPVPPEFAQRVAAQIAQLVETTSELRDELPLPDAAGTQRFFEYILTPVVNSQGRIGAVAGLMRDITERKRAESLLVAQNRVLEAVVRSAPLPEILDLLVRIVEEQSNNDAIAAIMLMDASSKRLHIGSAPSLPKHYLDAIDGIEIKPGLGTCCHAAATGEITLTPDIADAASWKGLEHLPLALGLKSAWSVPIKTSDGQVLGTFGTYFRSCRLPTHRERQIVEGLARTAALAIERQRVDDRLKKAIASAETANRAKDRFLAVLSHELRTPLSPVLMAIAAMEKNPDLPASLREDVSMIRRNIDLETKLIDDLLDLSRVTNGKLRLNLEDVSTHDLLQQVLDICRPDIENKKQTLSAKFDASSHHIKADQARLQQVFWNLLRNASKFTPEAGAIHIHSWNDDHHLFVEVRDTGIGIDPNYLPRLFEAFEQGATRTTTQFGGLGLGLAIAKAVVEMHGGAITAASEGKNKGAAFTVKLPLLSRDALTTTPQPPQQNDASASAGCRVLLVEDHPDTARTMARLLSLSGFHVTTASSIAQALAANAANVFDVIVSDIGLPDGTGYQLLERLSQRGPVNAIALSGYGMDEDLQKSVRAGFAEHLTKPVDVAHLEAMIRKLWQTQSP